MRLRLLATGDILVFSKQITTTILVGDAHYKIYLSALRGNTKKNSKEELRNDHGD